MAIILQQYAIKEVADVMFYELDSKGAPSAPVLYLDTLKTSTIEQSAETVDATGGKGNVKLLSWNTNKEINLTLEDAVFSAKSLAMMFGGELQKTPSGGQEVLKTLKVDEFKEKTTDTDNYYVTISGTEYKIDKDDVLWYGYDDSDFSKSIIALTSKTDADFGTFDLLNAKYGSSTSGAVKEGLTIKVGAEFGENTYYITGDTYARNLASGKDEFLQFIIPKGKVSPEDVSLTMEADGDPATFSMTVNCLKAVDGSMIKLVKYTLDGSGDTGKNKGVASILDEYNQEGKHDTFDPARP